jgi:hypothetical protein
MDLDDRWIGPPLLRFTALDVLLGLRVMKHPAVGLLILLPATALLAGMPPVQTVFIILMENHGWAEIKGSTNAPYLNGTLLPLASYCEQYYAPPGLHPSEPNYLWLEAGTNFGIFDNNDPALNHQNTTNHLVAQLRAAGVSWKTYQEDISGDYVPLTATNGYTPRHNPFVYFDDVTGSNDANNAYGLDHIRPYGELEGDLTNNAVARYNFLKPNLCNDTHDSCPPLDNPVLQGDTWLANEVPKILAAPAYTNNGALLITWDETFDEGPIGMVVLSPLARGGGYGNHLRYTHSSTLRTLQEIFGVTPLLGDAANAPDLGDLFRFFGFSSVKRLSDGRVELTAMEVVPGRTNLVQASSDFASWAAISTNQVPTNTFTVVDDAATNFPVRFYRLLQLP